MTCPNWPELAQAYFPSGPAGRPWHDDLQWEYVATAALLATLVDPESHAVIKTDAHNEFADKPCVGGVAQAIGGSVQLLEMDENVAAGARAKGFEVYTGSILNMLAHFMVDELDMVVDCSTLDHVAPQVAPDAINQYQRVLCSGGCLLLFVWESQDPADIHKSLIDGAQSYGPNHQFYFGLSEVGTWATKEGLQMISRSWWQMSTGRQMTRYIFRKP